LKLLLHALISLLSEITFFRSKFNSNSNFRFYIKFIPSEAR